MATSNSFQLRQMRVAELTQAAKAEFGLWSCMDACSFLMHQATYAKLVVDVR